MVWRDISCCSTGDQSLMWQYLGSTFQQLDSIFVNHNSKSLESAAGGLTTCADELAN